MMVSSSALRDKLAAPAVVAVFLLLLCSVACADNEVPKYSWQWSQADYVQPSLQVSQVLPTNRANGPSSIEFAQTDYGEFGFDDVPDAYSTSKAVALSLLLPGMGQYYVGERGRARFFFATEAAAWIAVGAFKRIRDLKEDDYRNLATSRANADLDDKDEEFYRALNFYDSRDEYNTVGRIIRRDRPYWPDTPQWDWEWDSPDSRLTYRRLRNQSEEAKRRAQFALAAAIANRLVSSIDAWRAARTANRKARMELSHGDLKVRLKATPFGQNPRFMIFVKQSFK